MKTTKFFLIAAVASGFALSSFAAEPLLSPRAQASQPKVATPSASTATTAITYRDSGPAALSPRAQANQIPVAQGANDSVNPAMLCAKNMTASGKAIAACASQPNMPCCAGMSVATTK